MDYGKLAYLKAVDLEDRLNIGKKATFNVSLIEADDLPKGRHTVVNVQGSGDIAIIGECSAKAVFYVDGIRICEGDKVFFKMNGGGKIAVESQGGAFGVRLMAIGDITATERSGVGYADYNDNSLCFFVCDKGKGGAYLTDLGVFAPEKIYECDCEQGDVCAFGDGFILALIDSEGTIRTVSTEGDEYAYYLGADKVAINSDDFVISVAYVCRGELFYFEIGQVGDPLPTVEKIAYSGYVDDVRFVKKGTKLLFSSGGKCYVKELSDGGGNKDKLYVNLNAEVNG